MRTAVVTVVSGLLFALLEASPAVADGETASDGTGDVLRRDGRDPDPAPGAAFADIVRLRSSARSDKLVVKTQYVELVAKRRHLLYQGVNVQTQDGTDYAAQLMYHRRYGVTSIILVGENGTSRGCFERALVGRVNRRAATVTVVIPTRCLGHPTSVRTGASSYVVSDARGDYVEWRDDARAPYRLPSPGGVYSPPSYGPPILVG
jgi:hypothetical protein